MNTLKHDAPLKIMIKDLSKFSKQDDSWLHTFDGEFSVPILLNKVHVQGEINKTAGLLKEILIINDGTGKAKITRGPQVPGDLTWIEEGLHCSVIGTLKDNGKLPHISAIKIGQLNSTVLQEMWPFEVEELKHIILDKESHKLCEEGTEEPNQY